jgi:hypothetical protein
MIALVTLLSCGKEDVGPKGPSWGTFDVLINGAKWNRTYHNGYQRVLGSEGGYSTAKPCQNTFYEVGSAIYNKDAFIREGLDFIKVPLIPGRYKVIKFSFECNENDPVYADFGTYSDDGDVVQDLYEVLESEENYITIESFESKNREVKGKFQVTFIIHQRSVNDPSNLPDTLRFTNGVFHTKIL